jgi:outer membrane autotransporter protein
VWGNLISGGASSALALSMFVSALTAQEASAEIVPDANLPSGVCISFAETDVSQCVSDQPPSPGANNELALSSTHRETITTVILPDGSGVGGSGPVQDQLNALLAGPNGTTLQNALSPVIGSSTLTFIDRQYNGTDLTIVFEDTLGPGTVLVGFNRTRSYFAPAGTVVLNIISNFDRLFTDTFQATNSLTALGLGWLSGDLHTTFQTVLLDDGFGFTDVLLGRGRERQPTAALLSYAKGDAKAAGYEAFAAAAPQSQGGDGWSVWTNGSFASAAFDSTAANYGFSSRSWNGAFGLDYASGDFVFGAAAGLGRAHVKQAVTGDFGALSTLKTGAYASWRPGLWTLTGAVSAGFTGIDATRLTVLPTPALSSYSAQSFSAGLEAARRFDVSPDSFIEPMAGLVYTHLHTGAFTETGGMGLGISGGAANIDALKLYLGARASATVVTSSGMKVTPELRARLSYDALNDPRGFIARMVDDVSATPFAVTGLQPNRVGGMIGAGVTLDFSPSWQASASYDAEIRGSDVSHALRGGLKVKF